MLLEYILVEKFQYPEVFKGIPTPSGSGRGRLGPIGIHCDAWKWVPDPDPMGSNLPLPLGGFFTKVMNSLFAPYS